MKKLFLSMTVVGLLLASCSDSDNPTPQNPTGEGVLSGDITGNRTLSADTIYTLSGATYVKEGATLTIPAGTRIEAEYSETSDVAFLAVERGAKINATGTSDNPIIFTSNRATPEPADWGGLVICGKAATNKGANAQAEVGGLTYGGNEATDNSGTLSYIIIEYSGNLITETSEFNALTFYGVGSGTTVNNIFINQVSDDGVEFFGGSVNVDHITVLGSQDDSFDWAEGWNGTGSFLYADQSVAAAFSSDSRGIEADNNEDGFTLAPISNPTLSNITLVGRNSASVTKEAGIMLRRGTLGKLSNVYLKDFIAGPGVEVADAESIAHFTANPVQGVRFDNVPTQAKVAGTFTEDDAATGAGNGAERPDWSTWADSFLD
ncbi:hypothetical protein [Olivibacter domesticus]|uniref:Right handed beta helix region n=1 Tax=Olivibacter domesticus TaxID=407022 RepID=A0A1H7Q1E5_OLID1|nr:hypothetical protein [Olivibacter domesticus]SEL41656.1 hypothetical protein SAMN05661044_02426 [Olivibacter domesticus]